MNRSCCDISVSMTVPHKWKLVYDMNEAAMKVFLFMILGHNDNIEDLQSAFNRYKGTISEVMEDANELNPVGDGDLQKNLETREKLLERIKNGDPIHKKRLLQEWGDEYINIGRITTKLEDEDALLIFRKIYSGARLSERDDHTKQYIFQVMYNLRTVAFPSDSQPMTAPADLETTFSQAAIVIATVRDEIGNIRTQVMVIIQRMMELYKHEVYWESTHLLLNTYITELARTYVTRFGNSHRHTQPDESDSFLLMAQIDEFVDLVGSVSKIQGETVPEKGTLYPIAKLIRAISPKKQKFGFLTKLTGKKKSTLDTKVELLMSTLKENSYLKRILRI